MGNTLLKIPPFHDAHIHFMEGGRGLPCDAGPSLAKEYLSCGVVSVVDMGHQNGLGSTFRHNLTKGGEGPALIIQTAVQALHKKGTYGGFLGKGVSGDREIKKTIREIARSGADFLKIVNSGIVSLKEEAPVTPGGFTSEEWRCIAEEAGLHNLKICCHANGDLAIRQALSFGVSSIEHGFFISEESLEQMAQEGISWTPTLFALQSLEPFLQKKERTLLEKIVDNHLKAVYDGLAKGIRLKIGTDSGSKGVQPGRSFFKELQLFKRAGLSLDQIVMSACLGPDDVKKGNYLLVSDDFIDRGKIEALYLDERKIVMTRLLKGNSE